MLPISSYKELKVWKKSVDLSVLIYKVTESFPKSETFGLTSQIRRCAVSIPSNIAEGQKRGSISEYIQFLRIAYGSGAELETQLLIAWKIGFLSSSDYDDCLHLLDEIMRMLNKLISVLKNGSKT